MKFAAPIIFACTLGIAPAAFAHGDAPVTGDTDNVIQYRQGVMRTIGANAGAIAAILEGKVPYKTTLAGHARVMATATTWVGDAFRQNTAGQGKEKTKASEKIWKDWSKFEDNYKNLQTEAQKVAKLAEAGDTAGVGDALKPLFKTCKSCHDDFHEK
jgi:cytochrome c556